MQQPALRMFVVVEKASHLVMATGQSHALNSMCLSMGALAQGMADDSCTAAQALEELRKKPSKWWGVLLSPLVTQTREYLTIHNLSNMPVSSPPPKYIPHYGVQGIGFSIQSKHPR